MILDAAGLALFAVAGTQKALDYSIPPFISTLMGTITGVGGGTIRDILLMHVPNVLRADIYATAALAGSAVMVVGRRLGLQSTLAAILGGVVCFALRVLDPGIQRSNIIERWIPRPSSSPPDVKDV
jgi:uncharacterized membrane protein YeiH